jgi:hypothetical protein
MNFGNVLECPYSGSRMTVKVTDRDIAERESDMYMELLRLREENARLAMKSFSKKVQRRLMTDELWNSNAR